MSPNELILDWLVQPALRALLLGAFVFLALKLARLRDPGAETAIWTMVLIAALAMPLLDAWLPDGVTIHLPHWIAPHAAAPVLASAPASHAAPPGLIVAHGAQILWALYGLVAAASLARLVVGLALTLRLYAAADPITEEWSRGRKVRASAEVDGPLSFADRILLPADYYTWPRAKLLAVLAHEEAHIRRGDFFIQLLASAYRALFWFSPFAWWLQLRLGELAETASDKAAIRRINDPVFYAEILVEVSRRARRIPSVVAMARGPDVAKRVDHILAGAPETALGQTGCVAAVAGVLALSVAFAQVHAAVAPAPITGPTTAAPARGKHHSLARATTVSPAQRAVAARKPAAKPAVEIGQATPPAVRPADITYNPRALVDDREALIMPAEVAVGGGQAILLPELSKTGSGYP